MNQDIDRLILEAQRAKYTERRTEPRHPFARPVHISVRDQPSLLAFSKDMSKQGIGIIANCEMEVGMIAVLSIHSTTSAPVHIKSEVRWSDKFGKGWYLTGWKFLSTAPAPQAS